MAMTDSLRQHDPFMLLADYQSYADCQTEVAHAYRDRHHWTRMSILNVARMGKFSSDRSIRDYCRDIWKIEPAPSQLASEPKPPSEAETLPPVSHAGRSEGMAGREAH